MHAMSVPDMTASDAGCTIVGVEITENAAKIHKHPFAGPTAFMLGNEVGMH
jgi:hypothetical protein